MAAGATEGSSEGGAVRTGPTARAGDGDDPVGRGWLHPEQRAGDHFDALRSLVARRFELEHALHLAQAPLLIARLPELVPELDGASAQREVQNERRHRGARPPGSTRMQKRALRALPRAGRLSRARAQLGAARARVLLASRRRDGMIGFLVSRSHMSRSKNARFTRRSSSE